MASPMPWNRSCLLYTSHYPKTKEGWDELGKRVATAHANYVIEKIDRLNCPTWQKLESVSYTHLDVYKRQLSGQWVFRPVFLSEYGGQHKTAVTPHRGMFQISPSVS